MNQSAASAIAHGTLRFTIVSLLAFGIWAEGGRLTGIKVSEGVLFAQCGIMFLIMGEIFLPALVHPPEQRKKFHRSFVPAFIAYAVAWSACWFAVHSEWLGLIAGCSIFAWILGKRLGAKEGYLAAMVVLFVAHSAGYFLGGYVFGLARNPPAFFADWDRKDVWALAKLAWGLFYGLGFGAGMGYAFHRFQREAKAA